MVLGAALMTMWAAAGVAKMNSYPRLGAAERRERILIVAVGEHLGHSERMLVELSNAMPATPGQKQVNISSEQRRAEDLLQENRLYRQTALQEGDTGLADTLDELERVLLDVAHSPEGRELLAYARRAARDPKNRRRLQLLVAKTRKAR
jgi:hypothetical protein